MIERYPVHVHLHPHATVADYAGVKALIAQDDDPFLLFMPEVADGPVVNDLQRMSDGDRRLLGMYRSVDERHSYQGIYADGTAARGRGLAEAVFDSGVRVVSIHPEWDEQATHDDTTALGRSQELLQTFQGAVDALRQEMPQIANIIQERDKFSASVFLERAEAAVAATPELTDLDHVPCLVEIGSLHFGLAERLENDGFTVTTSGETTDNLLGTQQLAIAHMLRGGSIFDLDLERIAIEGALHNIIKVESSIEKQAAVDSVMATLTDRTRWPALYEDAVMHL